jgi:predicted DsbA family dithiol-disulfide isomerase
MSAPATSLAQDRTITVFSDIACPWAHLAVFRLDRARRELGLAGELRIDHRAFPLELLNCRSTPKVLLELEIPTIASLDPDAGWSNDPEPWTYPVSSMAALEAVYAAKRQDPELSVQLDLALRRGMFEEWRCIAVYGEVVDIARNLDGIDGDLLWDEIVSNRPRADIWRDLEISRTEAVPASPTFILPDGTTVVNPGIEFHWEGGLENLVIDRDDHDAIPTLLRQAAAATPGG